MKMRVNSPGFGSPDVEVGDGVCEDAGAAPDAFGVIAASGVIARVFGVIARKSRVNSLGDAFSSAFSLKDERASAAGWAACAGG
jgi:hypothetical protein